MGIFHLKLRDFGAIGAAAFNRDARDKAPLETGFLPGINGVSLPPSARKNKTEFFPRPGNFLEIFPSPSPGFPAFLCKIPKVHFLSFKKFIFFSAAGALWVVGFGMKTLEIRQEKAPFPAVPSAWL